MLLLLIRFPVYHRQFPPSTFLPPFSIAVAPPEIHSVLSYHTSLPSSHLPRVYCHLHLLSTHFLHLVLLIPPPDCSLITNRNSLLHFLHLLVLLLHLPLSSVLRYIRPLNSLPSSNASTPFISPLLSDSLSIHIYSFTSPSRISCSTFLSILYSVLLFYPPPSTRTPPSHS